MLQCLSFVAQSSRLVFVTIKLLCRISIGSDARLELDTYLGGRHMVPFVMSSATLQAVQRSDTRTALGTDCPVEEAASGRFQQRG